MPSVRTTHHMTIFSPSIFALSFVLASALTVQASAETATEARWNEFQKNPAKVMNQAPPKKQSSGATRLSAFSQNGVPTNDFVDKKNEARNGKGGAAICDQNGVCLKDILTGRAPAKQSALDFFDKREFVSHPPVLKLEEMEAKGLQQATLPETPWSDTYWPIYQGVLGARYTTLSPPHVRTKFGTLFVGRRLGRQI